MPADPDLSAILTALAELPARIAEAAVVPALLTQEQAWRFLGLSRPTFFRAKSAGDLPPPVSVPGGVRYRRKDLEAWLSKLKTVRN